MFARSIAMICLFAIPASLFTTSVRVTNAHEGHAEPDSFLVYVGTYTGPESEGIYTFRFDRRSGKLTAVNSLQKRQIRRS